MPETSPPAERSDARLELEVDYDRRINFAMQQNAVPVVQLVRVRNVGTGPVEGLDVSVWIDAGFSSKWAGRIARLRPGETFNLGEVRVELDPEVLVRQTERQAARLHVAVVSGEQALASASWPVEVLPYDEWAGLGCLPEAVCAFVLPNHPEVKSILTSASRLLEAETGDPALSGYQTGDPARAWLTARSVYQALQQLDVTYAMPPASFEEQGQKVRLPDEVLRFKQATCLDASLLYVACLEQAGLNPVLVFSKGHAYAGVWLVDTRFPEPTTDDVLRVRKRQQLDELLLVEATAVTTRPSPSFEEAIQAGLGQLERTSEFLCCVDVRTARAQQLRPLPIRLAEGDVRVAAAPASGPLPPPPGPPPSPPPAPSLAAAGAADPPAHDGGRLERWKRKLLDLSLRNKLLNHKEGKSSIPLLCPDLARLEDLLASSNAFTLLPRPDLLGEGDPRSRELHKAQRGTDPVASYCLEQLKSHRLHTTLTEAELDKRLTKVFREARTQREESGANTLYLAFGFLRWFESKSSEQPRMAPILLLPVELDRPSMRKGFALRLADDDPYVNITLLEKLKVDFPHVDTTGLDQLPEDGSGLDIALIVRRYREAIKEVDRWEVLEEVQLGQFSFTKFLMWRDLEEHADVVLGHEVVRHLALRANESFHGGGGFPRPEQLDEKVRPQELLCPRDADSSQLAAILAATEGRDFVLQGPPGTGKSQTITNLIAQALGKRQTVLFVSEKMAALEVVHQRLKGVGLEPFCLEVHSNKSSKTEILAQLQQAFEVVGERTPAEWETHAAQLERLRTDLNAYARAVHAEHPVGESVYSARSRLIGLRDAPRVRLDPALVRRTDRAGLAELRENVDQLRNALQAVAPPHEHPFRAVTRADWSTRLPEQVEELAAKLGAAREALVGLLEESLAALGLPNASEVARSGLSREEVFYLCQLCRLLARSPGVEAALLEEPGWKEVKKRLLELLKRGAAAKVARRELEEAYGEGFLDLDHAQLASRLRRGMDGFFLWSWWTRWSVRKAIRAGLGRDELPENARLLADLGRGKVAAQERQYLHHGEGLGPKFFAERWQQGAADWDELAESVRWADEVRAVFPRLAGDALAGGQRLRARAIELATADRDALEGGTPLHTLFSSTWEAFKRFEATLKALRELLVLDPAAVWDGPASAGFLAKLEAATAGWRDELPALRDWVHWRRARQQTEAVGLGELVAPCDAGRLAPTEVREAFERSFFEEWISQRVEQTPALAQFNRAEHERKIARFRDLDHELIQLSQRVLRARLAARVPARTGRSSDASESGILNRQLALKRRHLPPRQLFQKIPNLLPKLKPCMLMSPLSVAQYLDPKSFPKFDLVVFDEASQMPVSDAIGAIARGKHVVVVGDSKQLPPTNFFSRGDSDDVFDEDDMEETESILDECVASNMPELSLKWHYRSQHENLIAFSNYHYYENKLLTFPAALSGDSALGVELRHVAGGVYDKGKSRTNRKEAEALVAEVVSRLRARRDESLGVVTFSQAQQQLVEDLLDEQRRQHPEIDEAFGASVAEPVFVKNLENVQGDERDVILFSICYGPDAEGRVGINFGPINREGGERRLNVAVTRARRKVVVFASLRADQIDLSRTRSVGVKHLKTFLDFAARGPQAIAEATTLAADADFDSPFEHEVHAALTAKGWDLDIQVGCSGYRIDMAVKDPERPGRYVLGIECDGAAYHSAKTARDRDRLREDVLKTLGWRLHRIWSTDWWENRDRELERAVNAIEAAIVAVRSAPSERPVPKALAAPRITPAPEPAAALADSGPMRFTRAAAAPAPSELRPAEPVGLPGQLNYTAAPLRSAGDPDDFYQAEANARIRALLAQVVQVEAPVLLSVAGKKVAAAYGLQRFTKRPQQRIEALIAGLERSGHVRVVDAVLWRGDMDPDRYRSFRVTGSDQEPRKLDEIPTVEIANAAAALLEACVSVPETDLARDVARLFGTNRLGKKVQAAVGASFELLVARGCAVRAGGVIRWEDRSQ